MNRCMPTNRCMSFLRKQESIFLLLGILILTGCNGEKPQGVIETPTSSQEEPLVYLNVVSAKASSFDKTPDWAPEPNPMAPVDGDMFTRWSSDYAPGEQWICFDLGQKGAVVGNMVIKWERAFATDYKISGSNDGETWRDLYHDKNAKGGTTETDIVPAKCRYIKITGLERINEDWGISIWEFEIYGPKSQNPQANMTKDAYSKRGINEEGKSEAGELVKKLSELPAGIAKKPFQKGVVYTSWMADELSSPASDTMLAYIKEIGYDTVGIMVPAYQEDLQSETIFTNDKPDGDTPTFEALKHAVETCHKLGLRVMIKPHVDPRTDEARINIMASEKWFDSYEEFILKYARFAEENKVEIFSVGTELEATTFSAWTLRWNQVISKVRAVYSGVLTYSANWTEYQEVPFWENIDIIGIDAYFPLTSTNNPTREELAAAWKGKADEIEIWLEEKALTDKGVIFTEVGYPSADGANSQPWAAISDVEDQQEQADCLNAVLEVLTERAWFEGYYIWQYFPQERWSPLGFTVKGKKAEEVIKKWLK
ncbi:MAG: discoidin domain-containing protein [Candidatus Omnitrophota bacterium]